MSDLIDRQEAIDALRYAQHRFTVADEAGGFGTVKWSEDVIYFAAAERVLSDLPSVQPEQRWIPCSERLPEVNGRYLVTRGLNACGSLWNRIYIANYSDLMGLKSERIWWNGNVGKSDFERIDDVIAWKPLPEPYKGEQE